MKELHLDRSININDNHEINPNKRIDTSEIYQSKTFKEIDPNKRIVNKSETNIENDNSYINDKQDKILEINKRREQYLITQGIKDALLYAPHCPEEYWNPKNIPMLFINE